MFPRSHGSNIKRFQADKTRLCLFSQLCPRLIIKTPSLFMILLYRCMPFKVLDSITRNANENINWKVSKCGQLKFHLKSIGLTKKVNMVSLIFDHPCRSIISLWTNKSTCHALLQGKLEAKNKLFNFYQEINLTREEKKKGDYTGIDPPPPIKNCSCPSSLSSPEA